MLLQNGMELEKAILKKEYKKGMELEKAFLKQESSTQFIWLEEMSNNYWIYMLKTLYFLKETSECIMELIELIEDHLYKENYLTLKKISRTAMLLLAIEQSNYNILNDLFELEEIPRSEKFLSLYYDTLHPHYDSLIANKNLEKEFRKIKEDFFPHVLHIPEQIFPWTPLQENFFISPVALSLKKRDYKMTNLLLKHPAFKHNSYTIRDLFSSQTSLPNSWNRTISLCYFILKEDEHFLEKTEFEDLQNLILLNNSFPTYVRLAKVFVFAEKREYYEAKKLISDDDQLKLLLREAMICSKSKVLRKENLQNDYFNCLFVEKSLVCIAMENQDFNFLDYFVKNINCKISELGLIKKIEKSQDRFLNSMLMWYLMVKYLLDNGGIKFLKHVSTDSEIKDGPHLLGSLFISATRKPPDIMLLEKIKEHFEADWLFNAKWRGMNVQRYLMNQNLVKESELLKLYLGTKESSKFSEYKVRKILEENKTMEKLRTFFDNEENESILTDMLQERNYFMHVFITSEYFTGEKMKYLIPKVDLEKVNSDGQTFVNILLDELDRNSQETNVNALESLLILMEDSDKLRTAVLGTKNLLHDVTTLAQRSWKGNLKNKFINCINLLLLHPEYDLTSLMSPFDDSKAAFSYIKIPEILDIFLDKVIIYKI